MPNNIIFAIKTPSIVAGGESSPENKNIISIKGEDKNTEDAKVVKEEQKSLPEGE